MRRLLAIGLLLAPRFIFGAQAIEPEYTSKSPSAMHPLAGFWQKDTCVWNGRSGFSGLSLEPTRDARQYRVMRCAEGCYRPRNMPIPATAIPGDPHYKVIDSRAIDVDTGATGNWRRYVKCSDDWIDKPAIEQR